MYRYLWNPLKWAGRKLDFITLSGITLFGVVAYMMGIVVLYEESLIPETIQRYLSILFAMLSVVFVLRAFSERKKVRLSWLLVLMNHFWIVLAISINENFGWSEAALYLSGVIVFGAAGYLCLRLLISLEKEIDLDRFHGHAYLYPGLAFTFLICCLAIAGFPITPTFIGEDLIFTHVHEDQWLLAFFIALSLVIDSLAIIRIYARVFLGPHGKSVYEMGYRSS
jgi:formate hydrogenlyase subunit 3/multisubunit Na+/H+ antiporter MnhD subunit